MSARPVSYKYLVPRPNSVYKQLYVKDRGISARTLYGRFVNESSPMTAEQIAADYQLPLEAMMEAIAYCETNPPELGEDREREEAFLKATGRDDASYEEHPYPQLLSPQELASLTRG